MKVDLELLTDEQIYRKVMREEIPSARESVMIATALTKQTTVEIKKGEFAPFLQLVDDLLTRNVGVYLLFAGKPSRPFIDSLRTFPQVVAKMKTRLCVRNHMKIVLVDNARLYLGSANLTGAGLGRKGKHKRNFEFGFFTTDSRVIRKFSEMVQHIWEGSHCDDCKTKRLCQQEHEKLQLALNAPGGESSRR